MKKLFKILLVILILIFAFYFPAILEWIGTLLVNMGFPSSALTSLAGLVANLPWWAGAAVGVGLAYLIAPEPMSEIVGDLTNAAADIVTSVGDAVVDVVSDVGGSLLDAIVSNPLVWLAVGAFFLLRGDSSGGGPIILPPEEDRSELPARKSLEDQVIGGVPNAV